MQRFISRKKLERSVYVFVILETNIQYKSEMFVFLFHDLSEYTANG